MKILSEQVVREINVITYFRLNKDFSKKSDFVLYTKNDQCTDGKNIYLANLYYDQDKIFFVLPSSEDLLILKQIVENILKDNPNEMVLSQRQYQYIDVEELAKRNIEEKTYQKINLSEEKFNKLTTSKLLKYPYTNMMNVELSDYKSDGRASMISSIIVASLFVILLAIHFISNEQLIDGVNMNFFKLSDLKVFLYYFIIDINTFTIIKLLMLSAIIVLFKYNSDSNKPVKFFFGMFFFIFAGLFLLYLSVSDLILKNTDILIECLKSFSILSAVYSFIITIAYTVFRQITLEVINKFKIKSFVAEYAIFSIPFVFTLIGLSFFYEKYFMENVFDFISSIL